MPISEAVAEPFFDSRGCAEVIFNGLEQIWANNLVTQSICWKMNLFGWALSRAPDSKFDPIRTSKFPPETNQSFVCIFSAIFNEYYYSELDSSILSVDAIIYNDVMVIYREIIYYNEF